MKISNIEPCGRGCFAPMAGGRKYHSHCGLLRLQELLKKTSFFLKNVDCSVFYWHIYFRTHKFLAYIFPQKVEDQNKSQNSIFVENISYCKKI
jgi:hypothetical protein